jgi:hypothetical protein
MFGLELCEIDSCSPPRDAAIFTSGDCLSKLVSHRFPSLHGILVPSIYFDMDYFSEFGKTVDSTA